MRNHYPKLFLLLHAASDFVLLLLVFLLSGLLRTWIPLGDRFSMRDIVHFFPLAVVYAVDGRLNKNGIGLRGAMPPPGFQVLDGLFDKKVPPRNGGTF